MEDVDRRRAMALVLRDSTQRILAPDEIQLLHEAVLSADMSLRHNRGVALDVLARALNGVVLSWDEANALAMAIDRIWLTKPAKHVESGVRDEVSTCRSCECEGATCPECTACPFDIDATGGMVRNSLSRAPVYARALTEPGDCGCRKKY